MHRVGVSKLLNIGGFFVVGFKKNDDLLNRIAILSAQPNAIVSIVAASGEW